VERQRECGHQTNAIDQRRKKSNLYCSDVIHVPLKREEAPPGRILVVPDLNQIIITSGHKERLLQVKIDSTYRAKMFFILLEQCLHLIVVQTNASIVERR